MLNATALLHTIIAFMHCLIHASDALLHQNKPFSSSLMFSLDFVLSSQDRFCIILSVLGNAFKSLPFLP